MKKIALIPARSGSKRIKNKNILKVDGKPMMYYSIHHAIKSNIFDKVVVVTDNIKYAKIAKKYGALVPKLRPAWTATDSAPDIFWVNWILKTLKVENKKDIFCILRPTSPFRTHNTIIRAWKQFDKNKKEIDSLRAVEMCSQHPGKMWVKNKKLIKPIINKKIKGIPYHSNQFKSLPKILVQNACIEISWVKNVLKYKSISGNKIMPFFTIKKEGIDINNKHDLNLINLKNFK